MSHLASRMPSNRPHILHIASEVAPFSKTGGLGDVTSALPRALARQGFRITVVTPRYGEIDPSRHALARRLRPLEVPLGRRTENVTVFEGKLPSGIVPVYFLDHPVYHRPGYYGDQAGDYPDNGIRFALLARGALELMHRQGTWPDIVHAHDWQAGLAPLYAKQQFVPDRTIPATVLTIHNLAFQGLMPKKLVDELGLGWEFFHPDGFEYYDRLSFLKAGILFSDLIATVSPRYATEIQQPTDGFGLDGFLRARSGRLAGILNGIDVEIWSPDKDPHIPVKYDARDFSGKAPCKAALQREMGLPVRAGVPLVASISRLTDQKGFDLVVDAARGELARLEAQMVFLGSGEKRYVEALKDLAKRYPTKVAVRIAYDDPLAHRIEAGADMFLMPSRFEPCGLNQMYSMRYGTIPIVRATGGLDDTVVDYDEKTRTGTGFKFEELSGSALIATMKRAISVFKRKDAWNDLVGRVMKLDFSWEASAKRHAGLYLQLLGSSPHAETAPTTLAGM